MHGLAALAALAFGHLAACGVDGVTPDCSDAATCAPSYGDAASTDGGVESDGTDGTDGAVVDANVERDAQAADAADAADVDGG